MVSNRKEEEVVSEYTRLYSETTFKNWQIIPASKKRPWTYPRSWTQPWVVDNWYWPSLEDWLDLRLWRMSWNPAEVTSTQYWVKWRHFWTYLAYFLILASDLTILEYMSLVHSYTSSHFVWLIFINIAHTYKLFAPKYSIYDDSFFLS